MIAGGATERLGYFAGYIHLVEEVARAREAYEEIERPAPGAPEETAATRSSPFAYDFDDMRGVTTRLLDVPPYMEVFREIPPGSLQIETAPPAGYPFALPVLPGARLPPAAGGGGDVDPGSAPRPAPVLTVVYEDGGDDSIAQIRQVNELRDGDVVLVDPEAGLPEVAQDDVTQAVAEILADAAGAIPAGLALGEWSAEAFVALAQARGEALAADHPDGLDAAVENGLHVDGERQPAGAQRPDLPELDPLAPASLAPTTARFGLAAETGGNGATNAAAIVDTSAFRGGMIVLGDYVETNAIVQTNVLRDADRVRWGGVEGDPAAALERSAGGSAATNIAEFADRSLGGSTDGLRAGLDWRVEVVRGDLYDVNMIRQDNYLSDGDVTVQSRFASYYELRTGDNQAINLTELFQSGTRYDLVVIGGSYREANVIVQTNILLDADDLWTLSDGEGATGHGFRAGLNDLRNDASITHYGQQGFRPLDDRASDLADGVASQSLDLATVLASGVPGNGSGTFNVLYIEGDYYNLNLISQINVIADMDIAIQFIREAEGATGTLETGANKLLNLAAIVQVGSSSGYNYLGGERYEDALLVQTEIVSDKDEVVYGDADALAPEIIAFIGEADPGAEYYRPPSQVPVEHGDVMGGVLA